MNHSIKTISRVGESKVSILHKGTGHPDEMDFSLHDGSSSQSVLILSGDPDSLGTSVNKGSISVNNLKVNGSLTTSSSLVPTMIVSDKLKFTDSATDDSNIIGSMYASTDSVGNNHTIYIDPFKEDILGSGTPHNGTVHILGNLIVDGDNTMINTTTHVSSDNEYIVNGSINSVGELVGNAVSSGGLTFAHSYDGSSTHTIRKELFYDMIHTRWTIANENFHTTGNVIG